MEDVLVPDDLNIYYNRFKFGEDNFHNLMAFRIQKILLIATFYDAYTIEHDGRLTEQITGDYFKLNLTSVPRITSAQSADEALDLLKNESFDLVICTLRTGSTDAWSLSENIRNLIPEIPILLLLTVKSDIEIVRQNNSRMSHFEQVFLWNGDSRLFVAMIKSVEDRRNVAYDTENGLVRVILIVEDSVDFYSRYLPLVYQEIMVQTQRLISEELNDNQKYHLMRTRPKVLLVNCYEEALDLCSQYADFLLAVISDIRFKVNGVDDDKAGLKLISCLKEKYPDLPKLLQSSEREYSEAAAELDVDFICKNSVHLMMDLRNFILNKLGFGDFVFRDLQGVEVGRAGSLSRMEELIHEMPIDSVMHHASLNHFSSWLIAHGEFQVARQVRPIHEGDFPTKEDHRMFLIKAFQQARSSRMRGKIVDFDRSAALSEDTILRLREGSLGGKGRGLAFSNALLFSSSTSLRFPGAEVRIPRTLIIATDEYDDFLEKYSILEKIESLNDHEISQMIQTCSLSKKTVDGLRDFIELNTVPLAIRSSSLLEDSHAQPFAGVYETVMIPNVSQSPEERLEDLLGAVKKVYTSAFKEDTRRFLASHGYRLDEEKMAVIIQVLGGSVHGSRFYPHFSGVAQSYSFYPPQGLSHSDSSASLAVGLGQTVVEGGLSFRYCPEKPRVPCLTKDEQIRFSQSSFYALNLSDSERDSDSVQSYSIQTAQEDRVLDHMASVLHEGHLEEGLYYKGPRIINFPGILHYNVFPLNQILSELLSLFERALGTPAEMEFAVDLDSTPLPRFFLLQIRPMTVLKGDSSIPPDAFSDPQALIYTDNSLGHGLHENLRDLLYVPREKFDKTQTLAMVEEIRKINIDLRNEGKKCILMAPGRWGSADRFLGIPVSWPQIDQAQIIVEAAVPDMMIEPSQGSHFFHNISSGGIGYLMVKEGKENQDIDWNTLDTLPCYREYTYFRHIRVNSAFRVCLDGKSGKAIISHPPPALSRNSTKSVNQPW